VPRTLTVLPEFAYAVISCASSASLKERQPGGGAGDRGLVYGRPRRLRDRCEQCWGSATATGGLTIQGDAGSPNLIEDFNPYVGSQLHGTYLLYEPLELVSGFNGPTRPISPPATSSPARPRWCTRCAQE
jgi:hypothetical protein